MSKFRFQVDQITTTRIDIEVEARTPAEAERAARRAAVHKGGYDAAVTSMTKRFQRVAVNIVDHRI